MKNENLIKSCECLSKDLQVLGLCLEECGRGSVLARNPYIRTPIVKKKLTAVHESIETVIQSILIFRGEYAKSQLDVSKVTTYYATYAFLYDFNDEIKREEYDHLILIKNEEFLGKFKKLQYQSDYILYDVFRTIKG